MSECKDCQYSEISSLIEPCRTCCRIGNRTKFKPKLETKMKSVEQEARELLSRTGVTDPEAFTTGDLVELSNLIASNRDGMVEGVLRHENGLLRQEISSLQQRINDHYAPNTVPVGESATDVVAKIMEYAHPLYQAFDDAVSQATKGKGVRHGGGATPFMEQPIFQVSKHTGVGGLIFQMVKKAQEACSKDDQEAFERELLGALVYGGAAYLYVKEHGFKVLK